MPLLDPLPREASPELADDFAIFERILGFVPNSLLTMQRSPAMVRAFGELTEAVMTPEGGVDLGFMRLIAHFASRAAGCQYCEAHSLVAAEIHGVSVFSVPSITLSMGAAEWRPGKDLNAALKQADVALYEAKSAGRDRVCAYPPTIEATG